MSLVELARYASSAQAHIVRSRLEAAGIEAFCFDTGMNLAEGAPLMFQVRVMVLDEDREAALAIVADDADAVAEDSAPEGYTSGRRRGRYVLWFLAVLFVPPLLVSIAGWFLGWN